MPSNPELELVRDIASFDKDPFGFVMYNYPWGEPGTPLEHKKGPRAWQARVLKWLAKELQAGRLTKQQAIQKAVASGHGIGKTALIAWILDWGMSTAEDTRGIVTAGTETQLKTKTWPEMAKWHALALNKHWFELTATAFYSLSPGHELTWRIDVVNWNKARPEAFAGLHNQGKRILVIFDEAPQIDDIIWETTFGALTDADTEIIFFVFGNPTRNTGYFKRVVAGNLKHRFNSEQIDSRDVEDTDKILFENWVKDYGEDSDYVRVRVRGMFPRASDLQFIGNDLVAEAQARPPKCNLEDPLIMSLDIARGGDDRNCFYFRRGLDAQSIPYITIPGSETRDSKVLVHKAVELIEKHKPDHFVYDDVGVGGPVGDWIKSLGYSVFPVKAGGRSPDPHYKMMRTYMWARLKDFLQYGSIDKRPELETDLTGPLYDHTPKDEQVLESVEDMKSRGLASPDVATALAMTFAYKFNPKHGPGYTGRNRMQSERPASAMDRLDAARARSGRM